MTNSPTEHSMEMTRMPDNTPIQMTRGDLKLVISEIHDELHLGVDPVEHRRDHAYIRAQLRRQAHRAQLLEKVRVTAVGTITTMILGGVFTFLYWVGKHVLADLTR